jgi:pimeloyl-ACP methyl ester carboxylesterase
MLLAWVVSALVAALPLVSGLWVAVGYTGHFVFTKHDRPTLAAYWRAFWLEWLANVRTWAAYPLALMPVRAWPQYEPRAGPPIALVHGYLMNRASMFAMRRALKRHGFGNVVFIEPRPLLAALETQAQMMAGQLRRLSAWADKRPVTVIAHSQGGLIARVACANVLDLPVQLIVSIGSPHAGTIMARPMLSPNGMQMRLGSPFLQRLPPPVVRYVSIYSNLDNIVFPKETSRLGRSIEVTGLGHHALCVSRRVVDHVVGALCEISA